MTEIATLTEEQRSVLTDIFTPPITSMDFRHSGAWTFVGNTNTAKSEFKRRRLCNKSGTLTNITLAVRVNGDTVDDAVVAFRTRLRHPEILEAYVAECIEQIKESMGEFVESHVTDLLQHIFACGFKYVGSTDNIGNLSGCCLTFRLAPQEKLNDYQAGILLVISISS